MKAKHPASKDCILGRGDGASKKPVVASRLCFATLSKWQWKSPFISRSPQKQEQLSFCLAIKVTYIVNSGFWLGVGKEALAVYLIKKRNVRLGTVSVRFQWLLDDCID